MTVGKHIVMKGPFHRNQPGSFFPRITKLPQVFIDTEKITGVEVAKAYHIPFYLHTIHWYGFC